MLTRRRLFANFGFAAAASSIVRAQPAPILQLKSRLAEAKPITVEERRARIARAQALMRENKIDAIFLTGGSSLVYFGAIEWWQSERLFAMAVIAKGDPF